MHHYCKKGIAGKKANIKTLHPASRKRYTVARPQVMPNVIIIIIITLFQEGDIYITIVNHDGPRKERKLNQHYSNH